MLWARTVVFRKIWHPRYNMAILTLRSILSMSQQNNCKIVDKKRC